MKEINDKEKKQGALLHLAQAAIANVLINHITTEQGSYVSHVLRAQGITMVQCGYNYHAEQGMDRTWSCSSSRCKNEVPIVCHFRSPLTGHAAGKSKRWGWTHWRTHCTGEVRALC
eukprot:1160159-Pelagomonas_calceolata.AAC.2